MNDRGDFETLKRLIDAQAGARFELPVAVTDAFDKALSMPAVPAVPDAPRHTDEAAMLLADAIEAGETGDPMRLARMLQDNRATAAVAVEGQGITKAASEIVARRAVATASAQAELIITGALREAHADVLNKARAANAVLGDHALGDPALLVAPEEERMAATEMRDLSARYGLVLRARSLCNSLGGWVAQHQSQAFSELHYPQRLVAGWNEERPGRLNPQAFGPSDPSEHLRWLAGPAAVAEPWLPTVAEQDEAWLKIYGKQMRRAQAGLMSARAVVNG